MRVTDTWYRFTSASLPGSFLSCSNSYLSVSLSRLLFFPQVCYLSFSCGASIFLTGHAAMVGPRPLILRSFFQFPRVWRIFHTNEHESSMPFVGGDWTIPWHFWFFDTADYWFPFWEITGWCRWFHKKYNQIQNAYPSVILRGIPLRSRDGIHDNNKHVTEYWWIQEMKSCQSSHDDWWLNAT